MARIVPGSGAVIKPIFNEVFGVRAVEVLDGGSGYDSTDPPRLTVTGCGTPVTEALLYPIIDDDSGRIVHVRVLASGEGYDPLRLSLLPLQDTPNIVSSFDIRRIWQSSANSVTSSAYQKLGQQVTDRLVIRSDNHPKPADIVGERVPGGGSLIDRQFNQTFIYRGGKDVPFFGARSDQFNRSTGIFANGVLLHTPEWGAAGNPPAGFAIDVVKYPFVKGLDQYSGAVDNDVYYYHSSKVINHFSLSNGVFENGNLQTFVWGIKVEFDNVLLPISNLDETLGDIEVGRIVEKIGGGGAGTIAKIVRDGQNNVTRVYLRLVSGSFAENDLLLGTNGFVLTVGDDPVLFPNGIFYINFGPDAQEFGDFIPNEWYFSPENVRVQRNYQIIWDSSHPSNQPTEIHMHGHPMQFSTTADGLLNNGDLYYNSTGASNAMSVDYQNEFAPTFIMNADESNRIYYYCKYHRYMSGYVGDEGYMILDPELPNQEPKNTYYIRDYWFSNGIVDYSRHANGHSKILGMSFDGYPIYGPWGYATNGSIARMESSFRLKTVDEREGNRPSVTTEGTVTYTVTYANGKLLIDGNAPAFLSLDRGKTYVFNQDDASNNNQHILFSRVNDGWHVGNPPSIGDTNYLYTDGIVYTIDGVDVTYQEYISGFEGASQRRITITPRVDAPNLLYIIAYLQAGAGFRTVQTGYLLGDLVGDYIYDATIGGSSLDPEYNNGPIVNVVGDGSDFFKREVTSNGVRILGAGTVGGQTAVPDAWLEKVARMVELFTDVNGAGINETSQRNLIKTLSGDAGTYHAGLPTLQRVARGAGADYTPNFLTDQGIVDWNLTDLFDTHVQNDMVWYLNSTGDGYGDGDIDAQEVIEHVFHTLHMHGLPADDIKLYSFLAADWQSGDLYAAMEEAYDAGKWDPSGYQQNPDDWKTIADAFEVAAKEYLYLLNFCMFEYTELWDGGSLAPEWSDDMRTQAGIQANNPLGYAFHNTYIAPVISKPSLATIRSIFQDGNTPAQDDPSLAGASGYVVDIASGESLDEFNGKFAVTPEYPNGTYAYFMTENGSGDPVYPYVIGPKYYGAPIFEGQELQAPSIQYPSGAGGEVILNDQGQVSYVKMTKNGDGYFGPTQAKILGGEGGGAVGSATVQSITGLALLNPGRSFATPPTIIFEGGGGQGATGSASIDTAGKLTGVTIVNPGEFYQTPPYVYITGGGGLGAKAAARIDQGSIVGIDIIDPGTGYINPPSIIFTKLVNLKRKASNRQSYNSTQSVMTGLLKNTTAGDGTIYVSSTDSFPGSGRIILNGETISYATKSRERFSGLSRGLNFNYDQRIVLDSTQIDAEGNSTYEFSVGDRVIRRIENAGNKVAKVYDWNPANKELLVTFEVDELAFIDAGVPGTEDATIQFDAGIFDSAAQGKNPHVVLTSVGSSIVTLTTPIGVLQDRAFEDDHVNEDPNNPGTFLGDGIPDLVNTGTDYENQISLDGGIYNSLYGIEETVGGQNTTLFQAGDQIKDASLPFKFATIVEAGQLNEGKPHIAEFEITIDGNFGNGQNYSVNEIVTGVVSGVRATVVNWSPQTGKLTVKDVVPYDTGNINIGIAGLLYAFSSTGTIIDFIVKNPGADYSIVPTLDIENVGDIAATTTVVMTSAGDQIQSVSISNGGYGYKKYVDNTYATRPTVTVVTDPSDATGGGAIVEPILGGEYLNGNGGASYRIKSIEYLTVIRSE